MWEWKNREQIAGVENAGAVKCGSIGRRGEKCRSRLAVWDITSYGTYRPIVSEKILTKTVASWPNYIVFLLPSIVIL